MFFWIRCRADNSPVEKNNLWNDPQYSNKIHNQKWKKKKQKQFIDPCIVIARFLTFIQISRQLYSVLSHQFADYLLSIMMMWREQYVCVCASCFVGSFKISSTWYKNYIFPNSLSRQCDLNTFHHTHTEFALWIVQMYTMSYISFVVVVVRIFCSGGRKKRWCHGSLSSTW